MKNFDLTGFYLALKCIDRIRSELNTSLAGEVLNFLDETWMLLRGDKKRLPLVKIDRLIGRQIIDEQDAGFEQSLTNRFYYAVSDLILYLQEANPLSVDSILEEALEFHRYKASDEYLASLGVDFIILTEEDEEKIESDERVVAEKEAQSKDKEFAKSVMDWQYVTR